MNFVEKVEFYTIIIFDWVIMIFTYDFVLVKFGLPLEAQRPAQSLRLSNPNNIFCTKWNMNFVEKVEFYTIIIFDWVIMIFTYDFVLVKFGLPLEAQRPAQSLQFPILTKDF